MRIKSKRKCFTVSPELKWSEGEIKEVSEQEAKLLLKNKTFVKVEADKAEAEQKEEKNEPHRTKRSIRDRS